MCWKIFPERIAYLSHRRISRVFLAFCSSLLHVVTEEACLATRLAGTWKHSKRTRHSCAEYCYNICALSSALVLFLSILVWNGSA